MKQKNSWDYALRIKGVTPTSIPLSVLAQFLKEFSGLLGDKNNPIYGGVVKGSALLRAKVDPNLILETKVRLLEAKNGTGTAANYFDNIITLVTKEGTSATVEDNKGAIILKFQGKKEDSAKEKEYIIHDTGVIDGVVIGISGADDTAHIKIQIENGLSEKITIRDLELARKLATHFRSDVLRISVHGTWKRSADGIWKPLSIYADSFEVLEETSIKDVFIKLSEIPGNGWNALDDPISTWKDIRGID